jgi:hypothetical protein
LRHLGVLVKTVTALDVLSGGRLARHRLWSLRRGSAGPRDSLPPQKERFEMLEETVQMALRRGATSTPLRGSTTGSSDRSTFRRASPGLIRRL